MTNEEAFANQVNAILATGSKFGVLFYGVENKHIVYGTASENVQCSFDLKTVEWVDEQPILPGYKFGHMLTKSVPMMIKEGD